MDAIACRPVRQSSPISGFALVTLVSLVGLVLSALLMSQGVDLSPALAIG
jgi:hypothetical protein